MVFQTRLIFPRWMALVLCLPPAAVAQNSQPPHTVRASADAIVLAKPDRADVTFTVYTQAATSEAASQQNAATTTQLLAAVKKVIGSNGKVKTSGFFASPQMQYPKNGGMPKITGYSATNRTTVTVDDLKLVSSVIDTAIGAGATQIQGVNFSLKNDELVRAQALAEASRKAYASAEAIAKALNLSVTGVLQAQTGAEQAVAPQPRYLGSVAQTVEIQNVNTPIEPADIEVNVTVTVTLEVR
jgi:uncharacterized protein YggE